MRMMGGGSGSVVVVIPSFNEEESLPGTLSELSAGLGADPALRSRTEVVVVDDGSRDRTREIGLAHDATVLSHPCNLGYGAAVSTGLQYAVSRKAEAVVILDADGQHDPAAIPRLLAPVLGGEADVTVGSRYISDTGYRTSLSRRVGSALFGLILSAAARRRVYDTTSGFQCIGRRALASLAETYPTDYPDAQVILQLLLGGMRVVEVPAMVRPRRAGQSMHSWVSVIRYPPRMMLAMLVVIMRWALSALHADGRDEGRANEVEA